MNPADHILPVSFGPAFNDLDSDSDIYIDECCVIENEFPQYDSQNGSKKDFSFKKIQNILLVNVIDRSSAAGVKTF